MRTLSEGFANDCTSASNTTSQGTSTTRVSKWSSDWRKLFIGVLEPRHSGGGNQNSWATRCDGLNSRSNLRALRHRCKTRLRRRWRATASDTRGPEASKWKPLGLSTRKWKSTFHDAGNEKFGAGVAHAVQAVMSSSSVWRARTWSISVYHACADDVGSAGTRECAQETRDMRKLDSELSYAGDEQGLEIALLRIEI